MMRTMSTVQSIALGIFLWSSLIAFWPTAAAGADPERSVSIRGIYGGVPTEIFARGRTLADYGINAVWIGSGGLAHEQIAKLKRQGAKVFAEFNSMHEAGYLKEHPDAAPVGADGRVCPPPDDWQGVCPTHHGYRNARMEAFRKVLSEFDVDGIWLDYHHAHASWEQAVPNMPETCFCARCLEQFERDAKLSLPRKEPALQLLGPLRQRWVDWRCGLFTDWVREYRLLRDATRPKALLGTFHCPWTEADFNGAIRVKLAIDLKAQARYIDVFSPMPYHARFGHASDPAWIGRQVRALGHNLGVTGRPQERIKIWPIVQLAEWGERVPLAQVGEVLEHGMRPPATGVTIFAWGGIAKDQEKVERIGQVYRSRANASR